MSTTCESSDDEEERLSDENLSLRAENIRLKEQLDDARRTRAIAYEELRELRAFKEAVMSLADARPK